MKKVLLTLVACGMFVGAGVVHGVWSDRWNDGSDLGRAAARLELVPLSLGAWQGKRVEHERDPKSGLAGATTYQFTHGPTGKTVTVFLACGRPGPVSVHTPDVCYAGAGFEVERPVRFTSKREGLANHTFFTARLTRQRSAEQSTQRIFWSWYGATGWEVSDNPRVSFAGNAVLYKMYVIRELTTTPESLDADPCVELMEVLVPALEKRVFGG